MRLKRVLLFTFVFSSIFSSVFSLEIQKNDLRIFAVTANDKFTYGLSQNKDDQLTATTELQVILPYFFFGINDNSITNRGYKTDSSDSSTFSRGRYDELKVKAGTTINLFNDLPFDIIITPQIGFYILGNFGMGIAQNLNHHISNVDEVDLDYEHFEKPFAPFLNAKFSFLYYPLDFIKLQFDVNTNNALFYTTDQNLTLNASFGTKTILNIFAGYTWNQTHNNSTTLKAYKNATKGFNSGFNLDTGLVKFDFATYPHSRNGYGAVGIDFMNLKKHNWEQTDISFFTGLSFLINTEFLETQIETKFYDNFSVYSNNKYVSGFKKNKVNPSEYRYERDYELVSIGVKYEQPLPILKNWITPYAELGTGFATFGIQKLAYHLAKEDHYSYKYRPKVFWQLEANIGLDIIPPGLLNFGTATYSTKIYAGAIFIPEHIKASKQIKNDTYHSQNWNMNALVFNFGFALHMGLDF